jgi:hypothetical protein
VVARGDYMGLAFRGTRFIERGGAQGLTFYPP